MREGGKGVNRWDRKTGFVCKMRIMRIKQVCCLMNNNNCISLKDGTTLVKKIYYQIRVGISHPEK